MFIAEEEYKKIIKTFPVFCVDFLIKCQDKYLLIKRTDEPVKGVYWVIGGRMYFKETLQELAKRVHIYLFQPKADFSLQAICFILIVQR